MLVSVCPIDPCPGGLHVQREASTDDPVPIRLRARLSERPEILAREDAPEHGKRLQCDTCDRVFLAADSKRDSTP